MTTEISDPIHFTIHSESAGEVDARLFGHFLERASFGEPGPESIADPETGRLPPDVIEKLKWMQIPVIRFPGGSDVDFIDWRDMIDNVPGREGARPITRRPAGQLTNRFGYDEYFALRDELGCETILVLNLMDAVTRKKPLDQAVVDAVGLLAYVNASEGQALPPGMPDWPAVRAKNGHPKPFGTEYIQIGNEWRFKGKHINEATGMEPGDELAHWYLEVLHRYIDVIRMIDPDVKIIIDGQLAADMEDIILRDPRIKAETWAAAFHVYSPGSIGPIRKNLDLVDPDHLSLEDWWYSLATEPGSLDEQGQIRPIDTYGLDVARDAGYRIACTEWNWNGWGIGRDDATMAEFREVYLQQAKMLGCAGFIQGLMRGNEVRLATQSMLIGSNWDIAAVRVDPTGTAPPRFRTQGMTTAFYARHHGNRLLKVSGRDTPGREKPFLIGTWPKWPKQTPELAYIDLLATADEQTIYIHIINRHFDSSVPLSIDCGGLAPIETDATWLILKNASDASERNVDACSIVSEKVELRQEQLTLDVPPRSVSVLRLSRR